MQTFIIRDVNAQINIDEISALNGKEALYMFMQKWHMFKEFYKIDINARGVYRLIGKSINGYWIAEKKEGD